MLGTPNSQKLVEAGVKSEAHKHDLSLSLFGMGTSIISGDVKPSQIMYFLHFVGNTICGLTYIE